MRRKGMSFARALFGVMFACSLAIACSCSEPETLCGWLEPDMVAFLGRPLSSDRANDGRTHSTFRIEERLWGVLPAGSVTVEDVSFTAKERNQSWFVLAGRKRNGSGSADVYHFNQSYCCQYGMALPVDHAWVKEFRSNVLRRMPATIDLELHSQYLPVPGLAVQVSGPGYTWRGVSGEAPIRLRLPPGEYTVSLTDPNFTLADRKGRASILPGSCALWRIPVEPTSSISGTIAEPADFPSQDLSYAFEGEADMGPHRTLLDPAFDVLRHLWQWAVGWGAPADKRVHYLFEPDSSGKFRVHVLPGKYRLTAVGRDKHRYVFPPPIPKTYYPGVIDPAQAAEIPVLPSGQVTDILFLFPNYGPTRRVEVEVVNDDGSPAKNQVVAHTGRFPGERYRTAGWTQQLTDSRGRVTFEVWQSLDYTLHLFGQVSRGSTYIRAGAEPVSRAFVIRR